MENGKRRLHALIRDGAATSQSYLGTAGEPAGEALAAAHRRSAAAARLRRRTISTLKCSGIFVPNVAMGRVLEVLANAGLFRRGIVTRADPTFAPRLAASYKWPSKYAAANGLLIEVLTHQGRSKPVLVDGLVCEAIPLRIMEYLAADPIDLVALVGSGVRVRVPDPARYAIQKLIVSQARHTASQ